MLSRRILQKRRAFNLPRMNLLSRKCQHATKEFHEPEKTLLTSHDEKMPNREPFMKNLFIGKFDTEFLDFPATRNTNRYFEYFDWVKRVENYIAEEVDPSNAESIDRSSILWRFKELDLLRCRLNSDFNGLSLAEAELAYLVEKMSSMPWLSSSWLKNNILPVDMINKYCSEEQKAKYLPRIANGELFPTICVLEDVAGPNVQTINTKATLSTGSNHWVLNGEKKYVANASDANLFIVFALSSQKPDFYMQDKCLTAFIVERNFGGISCTENNVTVGLNGLSLCTITFENTPVPVENVIGKVDAAQEMLVDMFLPGNQKSAAQAVAILRIFLNLLISHVVHTKHRDQHMFDLHSVQDIIGKITLSLYNMESALYMCTGFEDKIQDLDSTLERAIVQNYCTSECVKNIYKGLQLFGAQGYLRKYPYIRIFEDALALTTLEGSRHDADSYIALLGLRHAGKFYKSEVKEKRNPLLYPYRSFKETFFPSKRQPLFIEDNLHPSFEPQAVVLEECVYKLQDATNILLTEHGADVSTQEMELQRLGEFATLVYVLVAVLSRASRAYCEGMRHSPLDVKIACLLSIEVAKRTNQIHDDLSYGRFLNGDEVYKTIAQEAIKTKSYFPEHPLKRNL